MNFLQLCNISRQRCGMSAAQMSTVVGQAGEMLRVVNLVQEAYKDILLESERWKFLRSTFSFETTSGQAAYTPADAGITVPFMSWETDSMRQTLTSRGRSGEGFLVEWDFDSFRDSYDFGESIEGMPSIVAVRPEDDALLLGPTPSDTYTITGYYRKAPAEMALADASVPIFRETWHMAIVYRVMMKYGASKNAGEVYTDGMNSFDEIMTRMRIKELPDFVLAGSLA